MGESGSRVGPYQLRRLLGRGGMGEVYEAYDTVKDRTVALKLMSAEVSADPVFRARMQREAHTAGRLQEPHIVPIHDYGEIEGQLFIDMRLIEGTDVGAVLQRHGPLPPARAVAVVDQVAAALDAAHAAGIMHRDIKPENILLTGKDFAYLVDFGIAAAVNQQHLTQTGAAVGTWNYMAPERFGRDDEVTYRADIYALACVLYECLTGAAPYRADSLTALVAAHLYQPIPRPSALRPDIPAALDDVIARGMAKDPADRYARAGDLAAAAHHALSAPDQHHATDIIRHTQAPGPAPPAQWPPTPAPPWPPRPRRSRTRWIVAGAAALVVVAVLAGLAIWRGTRPSPPGPQADAGTSTTNPTTAPTVPTARLDSIMLNAGQVNGIMGSSALQLAGTARQLDTTPYTLSNTDCLGALYSSMAATYAGSGYTAADQQVWQEPGGGSQLISLGVVAYPSAEKAAAFVTASAQKWKACAGQTVIQNQENGPSLAWNMGAVAGDAPGIAQLDTPKDHVPCQHALGAAANVVLDVGVCGPNVSNEAKRMADAMAGNVKA